MRIRYVSACLFVFVLTLSSCDFVQTEYGDGNVVDTFRPISNFEEIDIAGSYNVLLEKTTGETGVRVTADENLQDLIIAEQRTSRIKIYSDTKIKGSEGVKLTILYKSLSTISISGAAHLSSNEKIVTDALRIELSGAGSTDLDLETNDLNLDMSGAGSVILQGQANEQRVSLSGAGSYEAYDLYSDKASITISGVGGAQLNVNKELSATVSGVGGISYRGNPKVRKSVSGLGTVVGQSESDY